MVKNALWDIGLWDNCKWDTMHRAAQTRTAYKMRRQRLLRLSPEDKFLRRHESDLKLLVQYLKLKTEEEEE